MEALLWRDVRAVDIPSWGRVSHLSFLVPLKGLMLDSLANLCYLFKCKNFMSICVYCLMDAVFGLRSYQI